MHVRSLPRLAAALLLSACSEAVYPPRPAPTPGPPVTDPPSSRAVIHIAITSEGLGQLLEAAVPQTGEGTFALLGQRRYAWTRKPFELSLDNARGKIAVRAEVQGEAHLPAMTTRFPLVVQAEAQPVLGSDYKAVLQAPVVTVTSDDRLLRAAEWSAGVLGTIREGIEKQLREVRVDLRPMLQEAYGRLGQPLPFAVGQAKACASLGLQAVEAGPTLLTGGVEKDLAVVLAPSVTLPCTPGAQGGQAAPGAQAQQAQATSSPVLPPLHNVPVVPSGPFDVTVPIAATYDELQKAMTQAFTGGKLYFSKEHPELYLERPEVYASGGQIVVKLHLDGYAKKGLRVHLSGDLFLAGRPEVRDNFLEVPDLQPTVETRDALLKLKTALDGESMRREVRQALRLDISARLQPLKSRLSQELSITQPAVAGKGPSLCLRADVGRVEVTGLYAHDSYLRMYVKIGARAAAYLPCPPK